MEAKPELLNQIKDLIKEAIQEVGTGWPRWMPIKMASNYSGLSERTLRDLARRGIIYATKPGGGKLIFDKESIDRYFLKEKAKIKFHLDQFKRVRI